MYNLKEICKHKEHTRPRTLYDYMIRYFSYNDSLVLWSIFNTNYMTQDTYQYLSQYEWFGFILNNAVNFPLPLDTAHQFTETDILTAHIYSNYNRYEFLPKISLLFSFDDFTTNDLHILRDIIDNTVTTVLYRNAEKYEKLFKANTLEFNPLWNVDGTETTIRTLERDGTETNSKRGTVADAKTGTVTDAKTGTVTDAKSGYDDITKTGTEADVKTGTVTDAKTGTETLGKTGSDTTTKNGQENRTIDKGVSAFNTGTMTPKESTTDDLQYENLQEQTTHNTTDTTTHNTSDTTTHNTNDTTTYNTTDRNTYNSSDTTTHNTSDTTTHNTTDTTTHNTTDTLTLDTIDTERIEHTRTGNIGITTTTKLLTEYVDFANYFNFIDTICHDIVSELCYLTA